MTSHRTNTVGGIPEELKSRKQWVCYRLEIRDGKPTKVPYQTNGDRARSDDPATWTSFEEVVSRDGYDGIGYVFASDDPFTGVDLDHVIENGVVHPDALAVVTRLNSYTEYSPSGAGLHIIVKARKPGDRSRTGFIEIYDSGRFFTMTGNHYLGAPTIVEDRQTQLTAWYDEVFPQPKPTQPKTNGAVSTRDRQDLLDKMFAAPNGDKIRQLWDGDTSAHGDDDSAADLALCDHLAYWTNGDTDLVDSLFRESGLMRSKWDSRRGQTTYGAITIARAIEGLGTMAETSSVATGDGAHAILASSVKGETVEYLPGQAPYIPLGMVSLLVGPPGIGKSQLTMRLAAMNPGVTLILTAEDHLGAVVKPRLVAAGADLSRVRFAVMRRSGVDGGLVLPDDITELDRLVVKYGATLVTIDPILAHLSGSVDSHRDHSVRRVMAPLYHMAEDRGCAVVAVLHVNKRDSSEVITRIGASIGFQGAARSILLLARDPEDPEGERGVMRVMAHVKCNYAPEGPSLAMRVETVVVTVDGVVLSTSHIVVTGESELQGRDLLASLSTDDRRGPRDEAEKFLVEELVHGPQTADELTKRSQGLGISYATLRRAKNELGVVAELHGFGKDGKWHWRLPGRGQALSRARDAHARGAHTPVEEVSISDGTRINTVDSVTLSTRDAHIPTLSISDGAEPLTGSPQTLPPPDERSAGEVWDVATHRWVKPWSPPPKPWRS